MKPSLVDHQMTLGMLLALLLYFLWMDVALYCHVQNWQPVLSTENTTSHRLFSPFTGLSVKLMMLDQVNTYIHTPLAHIFNQVTGFSHSFTFVTPNMISFLGLIFALVAAKFVSVESIPMHHIAILFFQLRTWCDALDGLVARDRMGVVQYVSLLSTSGYVVDGVADTLGFTAFLIGCYIFLIKTVPKQKQYLPVTQEPKDKLSDNEVYFKRQRVFFVVICFAIQLAISSFFWNRYINSYHVLLDEPTLSPKLKEVQMDVLRASSMWVLMWFWRISNAHAIMQMLLFSIFINRMWEFLTWIQYIGFMELFTLIFFSELHLQNVQVLLAA